MRTPGQTGTTRATTEEWAVPGTAELPYLAFLGRVRAWSRGCPLLTGTPRQQAVLAMLALRAGQEVTEAELVDGLYGDGAHEQDPAGWAAEEVRRATVRLGGLLGGPTVPRGHGAPVLQRTDAGYLLDIAPDRVDAVAFERLVGAAHAIRSCSPEDSADLVRRAFALWRGSPLDGLPGPFAEGERIRLHAVHAVAAGQLQAGRPSPCVAVLGQGPLHG